MVDISAVGPKKKLVAISDSVWDALLIDAHRWHRTRPKHLQTLLEDRYRILSRLEGIARDKVNRYGGTFEHALVEVEKEFNSVIETALRSFLEQWEPLEPIKRVAIKILADELNEDQSGDDRRRNG